jgi:glycosyltransferase involved in cell wall biosynthesis
LKSNLGLLEKFCLRNDISIIHTHHRYPELLSHIVAKRTGIKTVTTVHSLVEGKIILSFRSDKIIAVSKSVRDMLIDHYKVPNEKVHLIYHCIGPFPGFDNQNSDDVKNSIGIPPSSKVILFVGRITKIKGTDILLEAFKALKKEYNNLYLIIVGKLYDKSMNRVFRKLPAGVITLDSIENPGPYYSIADLVVLPSRLEPFGYIMLEAGLTSKPFIGSRTGGIAEFIEDRVNGLLFEPGNIQDLINKINFMLNNNEDAKKMADNLHRKVLQEASCEKYLIKLDKIYNELIAENN